MFLLLKSPEEWVNNGTGLSWWECSLFSFFPNSIHMYIYIYIYSAGFALSSVSYDCLIVAIKVKHNCEKVRPTVWISSHREMATTIVQFDHFWRSTVRLRVKLFGVCIKLLLFFIIIEMSNKAFAKFPSYCNVHYVFHRYIHFSPSLIW